jgi:membrane protein
LTLPDWIPAPLRHNRYAASLLRAVADVANDNLSFVSGGVAFFGFLAIFPAIGAAVMIWGLFAEPDAIATQLAPLSRAMPAEAYEILREQLVEVAGAPSGGLTAGAIFALLFSLWSATKGARALIAAMNIAYAASDERGFIKQNLLAVGFTMGGIVYGLLSLVLIGAIPAVLNAIELGAWTEALIQAGRWILAIALFAGALSAIYRWAPDRPDVPVRWLAPGAIGATVLWVLASTAFSLYAANFANYNATFGAIGSVIVLMMWMWLSAFIVCFGAVLNAELEPTDRGAHEWTD